ncbi:MAG: agmatinase [Candidatus Eremiobacteraeota bacterium]|nr:agmatinase [Candidatus Eremiobacteraeota bacterium]
MIKVIGIPYDGNSSFMKGAAQAPRLIRSMEACGSANTFAESGQDIASGKEFEDLGDIPLPGESAAEIFQAIRQTMAGHFAQGHKIVCLGGDHSITYPVIDALTEHCKGLNILHLDAHPDLYDHYEDNPYSHASPFARIMEKGRVKSLTSAGIRTFTAHLREQAAKFGVLSIEMKDFHPGFVKSLEGPLYLSLDLDVLDPAFAPGVSHHEPGGLATRELIGIIQALEVPLVGADIVELNPSRDVNHVTAMTAYKLFKEIAAKMLPC